MRAFPLLILVLAVPAHAGFIDHFATDEDIGRDKVPNRGHSRILIVPIIVDESNLPAGHTLVARAESFFAADSEPPAFRDYFRVASLGRFDAEAVLGPTLTLPSCPFDVSPQGRCTIDRGDTSVLGRATVVLKDLLDTLDPLVDFSNFDINGATPGAPDGVIDGIIFLSNIDFGGIALPHSRLCELGGSFCDVPDWDPTYDDTLIPFVAIAASGGRDIERAMFLSIHEFGHLLGLADLYDESNATTDLPYSFMGGWRYDAQPDMPCGPSRYLLGWGNPVQADGPGTYRLGGAAETGDHLKLGTGDEYFMLEHRRAFGPYDAGISTPGLALYHVTLERQPSTDIHSFVTTLIDCVNCLPWKPFIMLEQADGLYELQSGPGERDDSGDLFRAGDSFPSAADHAPLSAENQAFDSNRYDGTSTGIAITSIVEDGDTFAVTVAHPSLENACEDLRCPGGQTCKGGVCISGGGAQSANDRGGCSALRPNGLALLLLLLFAGTFPCRRDARQKA